MTPILQTKTERKKDKYDEYFAIFAFILVGGLITMVSLGTLILISYLLSWLLVGK